MHSHSEPRFFHHVSSLATVKSTYNHGHDFRSHLEAYWQAKLIQVVLTDAPIADMRYQATLGDYDLDCKVGYGATREEAIEELLQVLDDRVR